VLPATLAALLALGLLLPLPLNHWRADRALGRYLTTGDRAHLDRALSLERRHEGALIERSGAEDLELLLAMEPHHAGAHYNRTRWLADEPAIAALEGILLRHDPHHRLTRRRLRELHDRAAERRAREAEALVATDPLRALSILETVVRDEPGSPLPYLILARLHRTTGSADAVDRYLREAEARGRSAEIADERLAFEHAELAQGRVHLEGIRRAAGMLDADALRERARRHLAAVKAAEEATPPPEVTAGEGEAPAAYAERAMKARILWRDALQKRTRADAIVARVLAEELVRRAPDANAVRLVARAARAQGEVERAAQLEAVALFLETLEALAEGDEALARRRYDRALRAYPGLAAEPTAREALRLFTAGDEERQRRVDALLEGR
jgi:hypothetical protein